MSGLDGVIKGKVPIASIVVPFWGLPFWILTIDLVTPTTRNYNGDYR